MQGKEFLKVVGYINGHFTENLRLTGLAAQFGLSPFHLTRTFKKETGLTLIRYLIAKRLALSRELLERMSVTEACFEVGFESLSHFSRIFKKQYGMNPSEYKKRLSREGLSGLLFSDGELNRRCLGQKVSSFFEQYFRRILAILAEIQTQETDTFLDVADRCARGLEKGHAIWTIFYESGGCRVEASERRSRDGLGLQVRRRWHPIRKSFDPNRKRITIRFPELHSLRRAKVDDFLIAAVPVPEIQGVIERATDITRLTRTVFWRRLSPAARIEPTGNGRFREDAMNPAIRSHLPAEDGLVVVPEIPMIPFAPGSTVIHSVIRSALQGRIADRLKSGKIAAGADPVGAVMNNLAVLSDHFFILKRIGARMAERVISGGKLFIGGTLESAHEFTWRGSGLMGLQSLRAGRPTEKDVLVIDACAGAAPDLRRIFPILAANGVYTIIVSPGGDGKSSPSLSDSVHDLIGAAFGRPGYQRDGPEGEGQHLPVGWLLSRTLLWMLFCSYLQEMVIRGQVPFVFRGFHLPGGMKYNEAVYPLCLERGY